MLSRDGHPPWPQEGRRARHRRAGVADEVGMLSRNWRTASRRVGRPHVRSSRVAFSVSAISLRLPEAPERLPAAYEVRATLLKTRTRRDFRKTIADQIGAV